MESPAQADVCRCFTHSEYLFGPESVSAFFFYFHIGTLSIRWEEDDDEEEMEEARPLVRRWVMRDRLNRHLEQKTTRLVHPKTGYKTRTIQTSVLVQNTR